MQSKDKHLLAQSPFYPKIQKVYFDRANVAKLPTETSKTLWNLKQQLLEIVDEATAAEFTLFQSFGETDTTIIVLDELKEIAVQASSRFSQLSSLQLRIADAQPTVPPDMLELLIQVIANTQQRIPALDRSVKEIKIEWNLP